MAFHYSPKIVTDGLEFYIDAANPKSFVDGNTTWNDLSRSGNNGTLTNGPTFDSANGGSISFDGVNDYVDFTDNFTLTNNITVSSWVKAYTTTQTTIVGKYKYIGNDRSWYIGTYTNGSSLQVVLSSNGSNFNRYICGNINDGNWHHVSFSFSSGLVKMYIDSIPQTVTQIGSNTITTLHDYTDSIEVGSVANGIGNFFDGNISNVKIYNKVLTDSEIQQNYNATKDRFGL